MVSDKFFLELIIRYPSFVLVKENWHAKVAGYIEESLLLSVKIESYCFHVRSDAPVFLKIHCKSSVFTRPGPGVR